MQWLVLLTLLVTCWFGCGEAHRPSRDDGAAPEYRVTDPSRLFFLNVRASQYYQEHPKGTDLDLYRSRKFSQTAKRPILVPVIVHAYLKNEAYVFVRPNDFPGLANPLRVLWSSDSTSGAYTLTLPTREAQYDFALDLQGSILDAHSLAVMMGDSTEVPVFESRTERSSYLGVLQDYFRLTEKI